MNGKSISSIFKRPLSLLEEMERLDKKSKVDEQNTVLDECNKSLIANVDAMRALIIPQLKSR